MQTQRKKPSHWWLEEDQIFEWDMIACIPACNDSETSSSLNSSTHEDNPTSNSGSESSEIVNEEVENVNEEL